MLRRLGFCSFLLLALSCTVVADNDKPHVAIVVGTHHYSPHKSMPLFAEELRRLGFPTTLVMPKSDPEKRREDVLPGIEQIADADVTLFFMRFLQLPDSEWEHIESYLRSGKPVIGLRTANHSFLYPDTHPRDEWNDGFGERVLGTPYIAHQASKTEVGIVRKYDEHPILKGLSREPWKSSAKLYLTRLAPGCRPLLVGKGTGRPRLIERPFGVVQINESEADVIAWTWTNEFNARVFSTTLGHVDDFAEPDFTRMLVNAICWSTDRELPAIDTEISTWQIKLK